MNRRKFILEKFIKGMEDSNYIATPIKRILYHKRSRYQDIMIAETPFGKTLFLDDILQLTEYDEEIYHRALIVPSFKKKYRNALILGGGDGGAAREIVRLKSTIIIKVIDIDSEVTSAIERYIPKIPNGVFERENVQLINMDAFKYIDDTEEKFDFIVGDLTDLREEDYVGNQVNRLYTEEFLESLKIRLNSRGRIVYHLELYPCSYKLINRFLDTAKKVFRYLRSYYIYIPSFGGLWTFIVLSDDPIRLNREFHSKSFDKKFRVIGGFM